MSTIFESASPNWDSNGNPSLFQLLDAAQVCIMQATLEGEIVFVNQAFSQLLGYTAIQTLLGTQVRSLYQRPDDWEIVLEALQKQAVARDLEATLLTQTGHPCVVLQNLTLNGDLVTALSIDITERKRLELEARRASERLQILVKASEIFAAAGNEYAKVLSSAVWFVAAMVGGACGIRLLSEDKQWLDLVAFDCIDESLRALIQTNTAPVRIHVDEEGLVAKAFRNGQMLSIPITTGEAFPQIPSALWKQLRESRKEPLKPLSLAMVPMHYNDQVLGVLSLLRMNADGNPLIDDDLRWAQILANRAAFAIVNARLYQQLQDEHALLAQRVEKRTAELQWVNNELIKASQFKDEFLASMSHELRTPLNSILGQAQIMQEELYGSVTPKQAASLAQIETSGQHLLSLINDILDLSKIESGLLELNIEPVEIPALCDACVHMVNALAARKKIKVLTTRDSIVTTMGADQRRLKQILINLLTNAIKYTLEGGRIGLEVVGDTEHHTVIFTIWDTGIGISEKDIPRLFKPFVQLNNSQQRKLDGVGLGLSLVQRLVDAHHGTVSIESTLGKGSRFTVSLPWQVPT